MYKINELKLPVNFKKEDIPSVIAKRLKINTSDICDYRLMRLSIDARDKNNLYYKANVVFDTKIKLNAKNHRGVDRYIEYKCDVPKWNTGKSVVIVGSGPSGLFAALRLVESGAKVTLLERGYEMTKRQAAVDTFMKSGVLDTMSNIQFGEGGAGTFSDGKLNTGIKSVHINTVLETFHRFGADEKVMYDARPHIGTDILSRVIVNIRNYLISKGADVLFEHKLIGLRNEADKVLLDIETTKGVVQKSCNYLILAIGHSSRDTVRMLFDKNIEFKQKPFSMGYRIEHLQKDINDSQYGTSEEAKLLPPADYHIVEHVGERVVYSFCMCPGGVVVPATSERGHVVTNGMSYNARDGRNANSAILVNVNTGDFPSSHPLSGIDMQEHYEKSAYDRTSSYKAVVQRVDDFLEKRETTKLGKVIPTYTPGYVLGRVDNMLPDFIASSIRAALPNIAKKLKAFGDGEAIFTGIETRSSAPYQMVRDMDMKTSIDGVYAIGEGAGFAGGIVSSAVEGIKCADILIGQNN